MLRLGFRPGSERCAGHLGRRVDRWRRARVLGVAGLGRFFGAEWFGQRVLVAELVAPFDPVLVGVLAVADADQRPVGGLDLLDEGLKLLSPPMIMTVPMWAKRLMSSVVSR